jgi:hypothetical protein
MRKKSFVLLLILTQCIQICIGYEIIPYKVGDKWGYINIKGKVIVRAYYDYAGPFKDGYSVIKLGNKYAIFNIKGEIIIPFSERILYGFYNGLCRFSINGKVGFINEKDSTVVQPIYDYADDCKNNFIIVGFKNNQNYKCTYQYCILYYQQNELIRLKHRDPYCKIEKENTFIPPFCVNDKIYVTINHKQDKFKYAVFDTLGNKLFSKKAYKGNCNGVYVTQKQKNKKYNIEILYGINTIGNKLLIKPQFTLLECLKNGIFVAQKKSEKELFFISSNGNKIIHEGFDSIYWSLSKAKGIANKEKKWFIIDEKGNKISLPNNVIINQSYYNMSNHNFRLLTFDLIPIIINNNEEAFMNYNAEIIRVKEETP